ncbi:MAG TPA: hydantoinase B/oxoprolinase family protein, partial [Mariprofundaceae bacterium]|nr:hydantoinase B/oxoprolinase family protein [Mariprofundaceae bacterium]
MNTIELSILANRLAGICDEMGANLRRTALSPNIKDREDYSCALFDAAGELVAQAAHIPVHLGAMAFAMRGVVERFLWRPGDAVVFNDPFLGGTHLPDVTLVVPVFQHDKLFGFAATRAHHADIGGESPGSMGLHSRLEQEGFVISPQHWHIAGQEVDAFREGFLAHVRGGPERIADLTAQLSACRTGARRLQELITELPAGAFAELLATSEVYGRKAIADIPDGDYAFEDAIEDDGLGSAALPIHVRILIRGEEAVVDFAGTADQCAGPLNCPLAVTASAVYYAFRCLMPEATPQTSAVFRPIRLLAPAGSLINALPGTAVAAGNVETSQRIVDAVLGALARAIPERIPAAAQGTMNNVIFGSPLAEHPWVYYETVGGGMGAHMHGNGLSGVQCHMTNTKNTSIEVLEMHYPLRILQYRLRPGSGGKGRYRGGDGLIREWQALTACYLSVLSERRRLQPWGLAGGADGQCGR